MPGLRTARLIASLGCISVAVPAAAQELFALAGGMRADDPESHSYAWTLSYTQHLNEHLSASFSWLNEGHVPIHHRDGHTAQIWAHVDTAHPALTVAVGIGPYRYFDTTAADSGAGYANSHGWGTIYSIAAVWQTSGRWSYQLRLNRVDTEDNIDTTSLIAGIGYRLQQDAGPRAAPGSSTGAGETRNEVALLIGQTIVNSLESESSEAVSIEFKRTFGPVLRGSIALLNEGDARLIRRNGTVAQAWMEPSFFGQRFTVGVGGGIYHAIDDYREGRASHRTAGIVTATASYRVLSNWLGRFSWNRIVTDYDRDTDIFMVGAGYRF